MTDHIIKAAKDAGWNDLQLGMASPAERDRLARFWAIAYRAGMERAAHNNAIKPTRRVTYTCPACHFSLERQE